jgi:hypothetical protein
MEMNDGSWIPFTGTSRELMEYVQRKYIELEIRKEKEMSQHVCDAKENDTVTILGRPGAYKHPYTGKYVLVRSYASGVHVGILKEYDAYARHVFLTETRRLWCYEGAFTMSAVAINGFRDGKMSLEIPEIMVCQVEELIPTSPTSEKQFREWSPHEVG